MFSFSKAMLFMGRKEKLVALAYNFFVVQCMDPYEMDAPDSECLLFLLYID